MKRTGRLYVVAAPSGAGKTSLCRALLDRMRTRGEELAWSVSYTTRKPREGEVNGQDYFFVDAAAFDRMIANQEFAEWAVVHDERYGTSRIYLDLAADQGKDLLLEIDVQGARQLKQNYPKACYIFILPPSWEELKKRLVGRGTESGEEVERRLRTARKEMLEWSGFDYIIINDEFTRAVERLEILVQAARLNKDAMEPLVKPVILSMEWESSEGARSIKR